jgi:N-formylglutamate amidohydrolase
MSRTPYRLILPKEVTTPVVVASPHSGRNYDWAFLSETVLDRDRIRSSEDAFVDDLLDGAPAFGAPLLVAEVPRAFVDLNRAAEELDPAVIHDVPRGGSNPRISSGLGVIPRVVAQGRAIYRGKITRAEAQRRIDTVWRPYHAELDGLLTRARRTFGRAILLDCHSMPHEAIESAGAGGRTPEIVLGDRFGASAAGDLTDAVEAIFADLGFRVARNVPFAGAYVTQAYGQPESGWHAIQIEIDRALYMDEARLRKLPEFGRVRDLLTEALARVCDLGRGSRALAAE